MAPWPDPTHETLPQSARRRDDKQNERDVRVVCVFVITVLRPQSQRFVSEHRLWFWFWSLCRPPVLRQVHTQQPGP